MKEKLYTIPVSDAFEKPCECPLCKMKQELENDAIEYTLGPSYMEDDIRAVTDEVGFCDRHITRLYANQNRLGLALILKTHMDRTIKDIQSLCSEGAKVKGGLFKKSVEENKVGDYVQKLSCSCFVCDRVDSTFERYVATVVHMYKNEKDFKNKFKASLGMCTTHYGMLYDEALKSLSGNLLSEFLGELNELYIKNMERVRDDLDWFITKFDYRYANEPWKNSKDALARAILKTTGTNID